MSYGYKQDTHLAWLYGKANSVSSFVLLGCSLATIGVAITGQSQVKKEHEFPSGASTYITAVSIAGACIAVVAAIHMIYYYVMYWVRTPQPLSSLLFVF